MITIDSHDNVVVVTGAASGIGRAISELYLKNNAIVCGIDKNSDGYIHGVEKYLGNVEDEEGIKHIFDSIRKEHKHIKYLINCAGVFYDQQRSLIENMPVSEWENICNINLKGNMIVTKQAISLLRNAIGDRAIVNISSDQAHYPRKKNSAYAVTKAGIENFTKACAVELLDDRIRVNCILPASVRSNFIRRMVQTSEELDAIYEREEEKMPLGVIEPSEVAELAFFLGSEKASKITGQSILMNSGLYI